MYYVVPWWAMLARWGARILGGVILLSWGFFLVAHLVGEGGSASRPLTWADYCVVASLSASLAGLALAWKWELAGAAVTLGGVAACAAVNWKVLLFPGFLIPTAAVLHLSSWWMSKEVMSKEVMSDE